MPMAYSWAALTGAGLVPRLGVPRGDQEEREIGKWKMERGEGPEA